MLLPIMFFHSFAFGGGESTGFKLAIVKTIDVVGRVLEDLVMSGCEGGSIAIAVGSVSLQEDLAGFL